MAKFFSPEWVTAVDAAVQASPEVATAAEGKQIVLEQVTLDSPEGELAYHVIVDGGQARAVYGPAAESTVSITGPWQTYVRINKGEISPPIALLSGKARVTGERTILVRQQKLFAAIHRATQSVPADY